MNDEHALLRHGVTGLISDARDRSDAYYAQIIDNADDTNPLYLVPRKSRDDWTPAEHERLAVWNAYSDAMRFAIQLDIKHEKIANICDALKRIADIEALSSVREKGAPSPVDGLPESIRSLSLLWLLPP